MMRYLTSACAGTSPEQLAQVVPPMQNSSNDMGAPGVPYSPPYVLVPASALQFRALSPAFCDVFQMIVLALIGRGGLFALTTSDTRSYHLHHLLFL
jgi:hypothetical protein